MSFLGLKQYQIFIADTDKGDDLHLGKMQKSPLKDGKDSLKLKPFKKPADDDKKSPDSPSVQEPTGQLKGPEGNRDNIHEIPIDKKSSPIGRQKDDSKPKPKPGKL